MWPDKSLLIYSRSRPEKAAWGGRPKTGNRCPKRRSIEKLLCRVPELFPGLSAAILQMLKINDIDVSAFPSPCEGGKGIEGLRGRSDRRRKADRRVLDSIMRAPPRLWSVPLDSIERPCSCARAPPGGPPASFSCCSWAACPRPLRPPRLLSSA